MQEEKPKPNVLKFIGRYWYATLFAPAVLVALVASVSLGIEPLPWLIVASVCITGPTLAVGMWIRNQWLLSSGKMSVDTTKYERDGSVHSLNVVDNDPNPNKLRDRWGNRLFTGQQMRNYAFHWWNEGRGGESYRESVLEQWVKDNHIP